MGYYIFIKSCFWRNSMKKCPKCGSEDIVITIQYRKSLLLRLLKFACIIALFAIIISNMAEIIDNSAWNNNSNTCIETSMQLCSDKVTPDNIPDGRNQLITDVSGLLLGFSILFVFLEIMQQWVESKKYICCVCKDCKEMWNVNVPIE